MSADLSPLHLGCTCLKENQFLGISSKPWEPKASQGSINNGLIRQLNMEGATETDNNVDLKAVLQGPTLQMPTLQQSTFRNRRLRG